MTGNAVRLVENLDDHRARVLKGELNKIDFVTLVATARGALDAIQEAREGESTSDLTTEKAQEINELLSAVASLLVLVREYANRSDIDHSDIEQQTQQIVSELLNKLSVAKSSDNQSENR